MAKGLIKKNETHHFKLLNCMMIVGFSNGRALTTQAMALFKVFYKKNVSVWLKNYFGFMSFF